jgi:hypothetical protein
MPSCKVADSVDSSPIQPTQIPKIGTVERNNFSINCILSELRSIPVLRTQNICNPHTKALETVATSFRHTESLCPEHQTA